MIVRDAREEERPAIRELTLRSFAQYAHIMEPSAWLGLEQALKAALAWKGPVEWIVAERLGENEGIRPLDKHDRGRAVWYRLPYNNDRQCAKTGNRLGCGTY